MMHPHSFAIMMMPRRKEMKQQVQQTPKKKQSSWLLPLQLLFASMRVRKKLFDVAP